MKKEIERNYLEISSIADLKDSSISSDSNSIEFIDPVDFQVNKFFYKNIGKKHNWVDRLTWTEEQWIKYTSDKKVKTYVLKNNEDLEIVDDQYGCPTPAYNIAETCYLIVNKLINK